MSNSNGVDRNRGSGGRRGAWRTPFFAVLALAVVSVGVLVLFHSALDRLLSTKEDEELEKRVRAEIAQRLEQHLKMRGMSCVGTWDISVPIVFRPGVDDRVADRVDDESIRRFMKMQTSRKVAKVHVLGFASADGPTEVNYQLAWQRARTIKDKIQQGKWPVDVEVHGLGEDHLTNSVASSRSARIVACNPTD